MHCCRRGNRAASTYHLCVCEGEGGKGCEVKREGERVKGGGCVCEYGVGENDVGMV